MPAQILSDDKSSPEFGPIDAFFKVMSICHTVFPHYVEGDENPHYQATSPDELALVSGAREIGYMYTDRTVEELEVNIRGKKTRLKILCEIPFNSDRKRMSFIVRDKEKQSITMMTKGADAVMMSRIKRAQKRDWDVMQTHLDQFAREGLRTLVLAQKSLSEEQ